MSEKIALGKIEADLKLVLPDANSNTGFCVKARNLSSLVDWDGGNSLERYPTLDDYLRESEKD